MTKKFKRKRQFVDPQVQGALAKRMALHWVIYAAVVGLLLVGMRWLVNPNVSLAEHLADAWASYAAPLIIMLSLAPLFIYDAVKLSNRFAGPMVRLRRGLRELALGKSVEPIKLRDGDFWQDFASDFNAVNERVSKD